MSYKSLIINPGSTSTKIGVFEDETLLFEETLRHPTEEISKYATIIDQKDFRKEIITDLLKEKNFDIHSLDFIVGRGGLLKPIPGGTYKVSDDLLNDLKIGYQGQHASNLGGILAREIGDSIGVPSFIVDPVVVDELEPVARYSGCPELPRRSIFHALNQKEIGIRYAASRGNKYEEMNLIICHIGGGISVTAHQKGKMVDSNDIAQGDGPMAPTRCGAIPVKEVMKACFTGNCTEKELYEKITKSGGLVDHLGTSDAREVRGMMEQGNAYAKLVYDAMIYQIGKCAGSMAAVLEGDVDGIIFTGGISHDGYLVEKLTGMLRFIAPVTVMAGEFEMEALASGALRVLNREETAKEYTGIPVWNGFNEQ